jgi:hypothetical protein
MQLSTRLLLPLLVLGAACDDDSSSPARASLRFIHAAPTVGAVSLRIDGAVLQASSQFGAVPASYTAIGLGERDLAVRLAAGATDLATASLDAETGVSYTAVLDDDGEDVEILLFEDDRGAPAAGQARLRVINAAPSTTSVDIYVTDADDVLADVDPKASDLTPEEASAYLALAAGSHRVRVTSAGSTTNVLLDVEELELDAGDVRTLIVLDDADGGAPLGHALLPDRG